MLPDEAYAAFRAAAEGDPNVLGLVVGGSRATGFAAAASDYDVYVVATDPGAARARYGAPRGAPVDAVFLSLPQLAAYAALGSETAWNRYTFVRARTDLDKLKGEIARLVDEKRTLPPVAARELAAEALDSYVNACYRSLKNDRAGLALAARLDAAESIPFLLTTLFALRRRVRPFNKYLRWELETVPLHGEEWAAGALLPLVEAVAATGEAAAQHALFRRTERLVRAHGFGELLDGWEPDLALLRSGAG